MGVQTTRRIAELREQCTAMGVAFSGDDRREDLMDRLRAATGSFDPSVELDPMKCKDLKNKIAWGSGDPFAGIAQYLTDDYRAEPKLDGARMRLFLGEDSNSMNTGRRSVKTFRYIDRSANFPHFAEAAVPELVGTVLDGEVIAPVKSLQTHTGTWTNSLLNSSVALVNTNPEGSIKTQERFGRAQYHVFDVMMFNGDDISDWPYHRRRLALEKIVRTLRAAHPECEIYLVPVLAASVESIEDALAAEFEGVILKKVDGVYEYGKRSGNWLKVKTFSTADAFVVGYNPGENANTGLVGSLDLAVLEPYGGTTDEWQREVEAGATFVTDAQHGKQYRVRPVAQVGNLLHEWRKEISAPDGSLRPEIYGRVIEFLGQGVGKNGRVRHAHMVRLRPDKTLYDCLVDQLDVFPRV